MNETFMQFAAYASVISAVVSIIRVEIQCRREKERCKDPDYARTYYGSMGAHLESLPCSGRMCSIGAPAPAAKAHDRRRSLLIAFAAANSITRR